MNIFSEIYGTYFRITAKLLENELTDEKTVRDTVMREGFKDTLLFLPQKLIPGSESTGLFQRTEDGKLRRITKEPPVKLLTGIQKRWLKAKLADPRIRLFMDDAVIAELNNNLGTIPALYRQEHFRFTDRAGKTVALASSQWMTLSLENQRPQRVEAIGEKCPDTSDLPVPFEFTGRLAAVPPEGEAQIFPVRYSMEDVNGHLNNAEYMALAQDAAEHLAKHPLNFNEMEIVFHAAVRAPETLRVHIAPDGATGYLASGYREDGTLSFCAALRDPEPREERP